MLIPSFAIAMIVYFLYHSTFKGMIFGGFRKWSKNWPEWIKKPLYDCPVCMCAWWGFPVLVLGYYGMCWDLGNVWWCIACMFVAGGINSVVSQIIEK